MANPISVKGLRRVMNKLADVVMDSAKRAKNLPDRANFAASGKLKLNGEYGIDKDGGIGFLANGSIVAEGAEVDPINFEMGTEFDSRGTGTLEAEFSVSVDFKNAGSAGEPE